MNKLKYFLFVMIALAVSCGDDNETTVSDNCVFEQIDENMDGLIDPTERTIMQLCRSNLLNTKREVEENLIGEWELVGFGTGWIGTLSQPCGSIEISERDLTYHFTNSRIDTVVTSQWEISEFEFNGQNLFQLKTEINLFSIKFINQFCGDYMFGDATPSDGNMYLYEKVN